MAIGEGEESEARGAVTSQPSKTPICPVLRIKLVAELQMMLLPGCRTLNDIDSPYFPYNPARFPTEQDCESTIPISSLPVVNFKTSLHKLPYK